MEEAAEEGVLAGAKSDRLRSRGAWEHRGKECSHGGLEHRGKTRIAWVAAEVIGGAEGGGEGRIGWVQ